MQFPRGSRATIQNTSRADLNGQTVVLGAFDSSKGRYSVLLDDGRSISLKSENLLPASSSSSSSGMAGKLSGMLNNPQVQQYLAQLQAAVNQLNTIFPGVDPKIVLGGFLLSTVVLIFFFGMARGVLLLACLGAIMTHGLTPYKQSGGGVAGAQAAMNAMGTKTSSTIKKYSGFTVSANQAMIGVCLVAFLVFRLTAPSSPSYTATRTRAGATADGNDMDDVEDLDDEDAEFFAAESQKLYTWEDMTSAYHFGIRSDTADILTFTKNYQKKKTTTKPQQQRSRSNYDDIPPPRPPMPPRASQSTTGWGFSDLFTLAILGNTVYTLGKDTATGSFDPNLIVPNFRQLPPWRMGLNALMLARLFGFSPI